MTNRYSNDFSLCFLETLEIAQPAQTIVTSSLSSFNNSSICAAVVSLPAVLRELNKQAQDFRLESWLNRIFNSCHDGSGLRNISPSVVKC